MSNPTLINGFEDVLTFISQQAERVKKLEAENEEMKKGHHRAIDAFKRMNDNKTKQIKELKKKLEEEPRGYLPANIVWEVLGESEYHDLLNKRLFPECFEDDDEEE